MKYKFISIKRYAREVLKIEFFDIKNKNNIKATYYIQTKKFYFLSATWERKNDALIYEYKKYIASSWFARRMKRHVVKYIMVNT